MDVFTIERGEERAAQSRQNALDHQIAFVLQLFELVGTTFEVVELFHQFSEGLCCASNDFANPVKQIKEFLLARYPSNRHVLLLVGIGRVTSPSRHALLRHCGILALRPYFFPFPPGFSPLSSAVSPKSRGS